MYALKGEREVHWEGNKNLQGRGDGGYAQTIIHSEKNI